MQIIRREEPAVAMELEHRRAIGLLRRVHLGLVGQLAALHQIARRASGDDVLPPRQAAARAGHEMIEGEILIVAAILAGEVSGTTR